MFVPEGWQEEKKLSILPYNSRLLPTGLPDPPELGIHAFLPDSLEKYDILSVCGSTNSHHVGSAQTLQYFLFIPKNLVIPPLCSSVCLWIRWRDYCSLYMSAWRPTLQMRAWERKKERVKMAVGEIQTPLKLESWWGRVGI